MLQFELLCVLIFIIGINAGRLREDEIPQAPASVSVEITSPTTAEVSWLPPPNHQVKVRGYTVEYGIRNLDENSIEVDDRTITTLVTDLEPDAGYLFRVLAFNNYGPGLPAYSEKVNTPPAEIDAGLTAPIVNVEVKSSDSVLVSWTGIKGATDGRSYSLRYKSKPPSRWTEIETTDTSYLVSGLEPDTLYEFQVKVQTDEDESLYSIGEFQRTEKDCPKPLGIEDGSIPDDKLSHSSTFDPVNLGAQHARLNGPGGWAPEDTDEDPWVGVDLGEEVEITGVVTQGNGKPSLDQWVTSYVVQYSNDELQWDQVLEGDTDQPKVFSGNTDGTTPVTNAIEPSITAQYLRILPVTWNSYCTLRFEVLGCRVNSNGNPGNGYDGQCEPVTVPLCNPAIVPYNYTILPNIFGQTDQSEISIEMGQWLAIAFTGCSPMIGFFLCSVYVPVCTALELPIPPCREICQMVQGDCQAVIDANQDLTWPEELNCENFPSMNDTSSLCVGSDGPPPGFPDGPLGPDGEPPAHCEPIEIVEMCDPSMYPEIPYNYTMFPNILGHESQDHAAYDSIMLESAVESGCSPLLRFFVCILHVPACSPIPSPVPPCRELCEIPRDQCQDYMDSQGQTWPENMACESFPSINDGMCIGFTTEGPETGPSDNTTEGSGSGDDTGSEDGDLVFIPPDITEGTAICQPISDAAKELCPGLEYTETIFPNTLGHVNQEEAIEMLNTQIYVMGMECPIGQFLCVLAFPPCKRFGDNGETAVPLLPCREECAYVKTACVGVNFDDVIQSVDRWSTELDCDKFPEVYSNPPLCWEITNGFLREDIPIVEKEVCTTDILDSCQARGFKATSYPNKFDHANSTYALEALEELQPLIDSMCSPEINSFVCASLFPHCDVNGTVSFVCHESCRRVWKACKQTAQDLGMDRPKVFSCSKFYDSREEDSSCLYSVTPPVNPPKVKSVDRSPTTAKLVLLPEDNNAKFFKTKFFGPLDFEEKQFDVSTGKTTSVTFDNLDPGHVYYAAIQTGNEFGDSPSIFETVEKHEGTKCQPLEIELCKDLGYDMALADGHPNSLGHIDQAEAYSHLESFRPLIEFSCSPELKKFLCWLFVPGCSPDVNEVIPPCRESCEESRFGCETIMVAFGYEWPEFLDCEQFPYRNESGLCEGGDQLSYWGTQGSDGSEYHCMKLFEVGPEPMWYDPSDNVIEQDPKQAVYTEVLSNRMTRLVITESSQEVSGSYKCRSGDLETEVEIGQRLAGTCYSNNHAVCSNLYDSFRLPNIMNQTEEKDALLSVNAFLPLVATNCSEYLSVFACYLYLPSDQCQTGSQNTTWGYGTTETPCRELCYKAQLDCASVMDDIGFLWPESVSCDSLPSASGNMCDHFGISEMDLLVVDGNRTQNMTDFEFVTDITDYEDINVTAVYPTDITGVTELYTEEPYTELTNFTEEIPVTDGLNDTDAANLTDGMCASLTPRRYDIEDLGSSCLFRGWADVQAQGAANDYCRVVTQGGPKFLSCALAGATDDHVYTSPNASVDWWDAGHTDTWYMRDEDGDGRDDYCRCVGVPPDTVVSCMKAGESGFLGHDDFQIEDSTECEYNKINPFFGAP